MKRIICAAIVFSIIFCSLLSFSASAAVLGDVNTDGKVNSTDALIVLNYSVGKDTLSSSKRLLADYNHDNVINSADALGILTYATSNNGGGEAGDGELG